jgi:hypothetical protein
MPPPGGYVALDVEVGPFLQKQAGDLRVPLFRGFHQGSEPVLEVRKKTETFI